MNKERTERIIGKNIQKGRGKHVVVSTSFRKGGQA
jgi:hypothetical protein